MKILKTDGEGLQKLYNRNLFSRKKHVEERVRQIIADVQNSGDDAVLKYTRKFDKCKLAAKQIRADESEISGAFQNITSDFVTSLKRLSITLRLFTVNN